jgi:type VI secretion system protein
MSLGMPLKKKPFRFILLLLILGLAACVSTDGFDFPPGSISIDADPDANQNSAIAVDVVLIYDPELLEMLGHLSAAQYFTNVQQLLRDYPSLINIWHWELVPGQKVSHFIPDQRTADAYGGYVFANYYTIGDHRVRIPPNQRVGIVLQRDDLQMAN